MLNSSPYRRHIFQLLQHPIWTNRYFFITIFIAVHVSVAFLLLPRFGYDLATANEGWRVAINGIPSLDTIELTYSPLPLIITWLWQQIFGLSALSVFAFLFITGSLTTFLVLQGIQRLFNQHVITIWTGYALVLSPYLTWSIYVNRDITLDMLGVALLMQVAIHIYQKREIRFIVLLGFAGALATSIREPNLLIVPAILVIFWFTRHIKLMDILIAIIALIIGLIPLLTFNYIATDTITLSSRTGINLFIGNHPMYLAGHPQYDIDLFFASCATAQFQQSGFANSNDYYSQAAQQFIGEDIIGFTYRSILKAYWWVGLGRVPQSDQRASLTSDCQTIQFNITTPNPIKEVAYMLHRTFLFIGLFAYIRYQRNKGFEAILLLLPLFAIMPIVMITFPDTRFRLAVDGWTYAIAMAGWFWWVTHLRMTLLPKPTQLS